VRLNDTLLLPENEDLIAEVACHEIAHVAAYELHGGVSAQSDRAFSVGTRRWSNQGSISRLCARSWGDYTASVTRPGARFGKGRGGGRSSQLQSVEIQS
jgi:hypothetical protein